MERKLAIKKFYEEKIMSDFGDEIFDPFQEKYEIANTCFNPDDVYKFENIDIEQLALKLLKEEVPTSVLSAFKRHIWYAKHLASHIIVFKIPVNKVTTFAICISGYVDDGWDNAGQFIEVYDEEGQLVGAKIVYEDDLDDWRWMNRPIREEDFNHPAPPWLEEEYKS